MSPRRGLELCHELSGHWRDRRGPGDILLGVERQSGIESGLFRIDQGPPQRGRDRRTDAEPGLRCGCPDHVNDILREADRQLHEWRGRIRRRIWRDGFEQDPALRVDLTHGGTDGMTTGTSRQASKNRLFDAGTKACRLLEFATAMRKDPCR